MNPTELSTANGRSALPPILRAEAEDRLPPRRDWTWTIGPAYLGVFIWFPFLDSACATVGGFAGLGSLVAAALLGVLLAHGLLYVGPALWGWKAGQRLGLTAAAALGTAGSEWVTGLGGSAAAILWYALALDYAVRLEFLGLMAFGLLEPAAFSPIPLGPFVVLSPVVLATAAFWILITGLACLLRLVGVVAALLQVYAPLAVVLLALAAGFNSAGLVAFGEGGATVPAGARGEGPLALIQRIFSYFAFAGIMAVEWGGAVRTRRDVFIGGWYGVLLGGWCATLFALLTVAGAAARSRLVESSGIAGMPPISLQGALLGGIGGVTGGILVMLFGLAALAPAVYSADRFGRKLADRWPRLGRGGATWLGGGVALVLMATGWGGQAELVFTLTGGVFAALAGVLVAEALRCGGAWRGMRPGVHGVGLAAWGAGALVGIVPSLGVWLGWPAAARLEPAAVVAFLTSLVIYALAAKAPARWEAVPTMAESGAPAAVPGGGST